MRNFSYTRASTSQDALCLITTVPNAKFLGGGTNLVDLMRENIERPDALIDVTRLPSTGITESPEGGVSIGAEVKNTAVANHPLIRKRFPLLSQAILFGASGQIRNMATVAGNIMQRTRCYYFYDESSKCNKRSPASGCDAIDGFNRIHAILGASEHCIATHPSDMCVALAALDATVRVSGPKGERIVALNTFHRLPGDTPHIETTLQPDELITAIELPPFYSREALPLPESARPCELCVRARQRSSSLRSGEPQNPQRAVSARRGCAKTMESLPSRKRACRGGRQHGDIPPGSRS